MLDLFSGLGGFSEAFVLAGDEVVRVENNPLLSEVPLFNMSSTTFAPSTFRRRIDIKARSRS